MPAILNDLPVAEINIAPRPIHYDPWRIAWNGYYTMSLVGDAKAFVSFAVLHSIDARLEGFTKSRFALSHGRLFCAIHPDEMSILLRRLSDMEDMEEFHTEDDSPGSLIDEYKQWIAIKANNPTSLLVPKMIDELLAAIRYKAVIILAFTQ